MPQLIVEWCHTPIVNSLSAPARRPGTEQLHECNVNIDFYHGDEQTSGLSMELYAPLLHCATEGYWHVPISS